MKLKTCCISKIGLTLFSILLLISVVSSQESSNQIIPLICTAEGMKKMTEKGSFRFWIENLVSLFDENVKVELSGVQFNSKTQFYEEFQKVIKGYGMKRGRAMTVSTPIVNSIGKTCSFHYIEAATIGAQHCLVMKENMGHARWNDKSKIIEYHETSNPDWMTQMQYCLNKKNEKK